MYTDDRSFTKSYTARYTPLNLNASQDSSTSASREAVLAIM